MFQFIRRKIGVKVAIFVNIFIFFSMLLGMFILVQRQNASLEAELLRHGQIQTLVGAKMISKILDESIDNGLFSLDDI